MVLPPPKTFQELAEEVLPSPHWIVDDLLPGGGWTLLVAKPKTGKSLLAMQLAAALSRGGEWIGRPVKQRRVCYIQLDAPHEDWQKQVRFLTLNDRLKPYTYDRRYLPIQLLDTTHITVQSQLREHLKKLEIELVIWDALEKLTGKNLNEKENCQAVLERMRLVFPGPSLVIHHPRKPNGDAVDSIVDAAAGNHYLTADASCLWALKSKGKQEGKLTVRPRIAKEQELDLAREPKTGLWLPAQSKAPVTTDDSKLADDWLKT
jgi:RecA-family ATPase